MGWNDPVPELGDEDYNKTTTNLMIVIGCCFGMCITMYMLGKSDGREDVLKEIGNDSIKTCAAVVITKD